MRLLLVSSLVLAVMMAHSVSALTCVFLHGIGQNGPGTATKNKFTDSNYLRKSLPSYWGDLDVRARKAGCTDVYMFWTDSVSRGWNNAALQSEYCGVLAYTNADIVFGHSMAGMVIAGGIKNGVAGCERIGNAPTSKTHWYGLQSPLGGSIAADALGRVCTNKIAAAFLGKGCQKKSDGSMGISSAYSSLQPANSPAYLKATALAHESGNMCGLITDNTAASVDGGIVKKVEKAGISLALSAIRDLVNSIIRGQADWNQPNKPTPSGSAVQAFGSDGMVALGSCHTAPLSSYHKNPASAYYAFEGNHGDGRCTFGEDPKNLNFQPCSYVQNMIKRTIAQRAAAGMHFEQIVDEDEAQDQDEVDADVDETDEDVEEVADEDEDQFEADAEDEDELEADAEDEVEDEDEAVADDEDEVEVDDEVDHEVDEEVDADVEDDA